ncbi:MAG: hypothetical protein ACRD3K_13815, partial [Edaphobacter sp.]
GALKPLGYAFLQPTKKRPDSLTVEQIPRPQKNNFFKFRPEIACQAPKPPNSLKQRKIELAY